MVARHVHAMAVDDAKHQSLLALVSLGHLCHQPLENIRSLVQLVVCPHEPVPLCEQPLLRESLLVSGRSPRLRPMHPENGWHELRTSARY